LETIAGKGLLGVWRLFMRNLFAVATMLGLFMFLSYFTKPAGAEAEGIGWIPTWRQAIEEATKSRKPILLVAAAPQCAGVPGIW